MARKKIAKKLKAEEAGDRLPCPSNERMMEVVDKEYLQNTSQTSVCLIIIVVATAAAPPVPFPMIKAMTA